MSSLLFVRASSLLRPRLAARAFATKPGVATPEELAAFISEAAKSGEAVTVVDVRSLEEDGEKAEQRGAAHAIAGTALGLATLIWLLYYDWHWAALPIVTLVPGFMVFNSARMVAQSAAVSKVPAPADRAGFMALVQSVTQVAGGLAALTGSAMLTTGDKGELHNMEAVALVSLVITLLAPPLIWALERRLPRNADVSHRVKAMVKGSSGG